jgi:hypothetical protein
VAPWVFSGFIVVLIGAGISGRWLRRRRTSVALGAGSSEKSSSSGVASNRREIALRGDLNWEQPVILFFNNRVTLATAFF